MSDDCGLRFAKPAGGRCLPLELTLRVGSSYPCGCSQGRRRRWFGDTVVDVHDEPLDPFNGDPTAPAPGLDDVEPDGMEPWSHAERQDVIEDLADLEVYQALLAPIGIRGLVIECEDCHEPHYFDWDLLRGNLKHLLNSGRPR